MPRGRPGSRRPKPPRALLPTANGTTNALRHGANATAASAAPTKRIDAATSEAASEPAKNSRLDCEQRGRSAGRRRRPGARGGEQARRCRRGGARRSTTGRCDRRSSRSGPPWSCLVSPVPDRHDQSSRLGRRRARVTWSPAPNAVAPGRAARFDVTDLTAGVLRHRRLTSGPRGSLRQRRARPSRAPQVRGRSGSHAASSLGRHRSHPVGKTLPTDRVAPATTVPVALRAFTSFIHRISRGDGRGTSVASRARRRDRVVGRARRVGRARSGRSRRRLAGRTISLTQAGTLSCHDFDYPVLRCFASPTALELDVARRARDRRRSPPS